MLARGEEAMTARTADVLGGRYELGALIGQGGVAQVFRARDRVLERDVAVKLFGPGIDLNAAERERAEMRTLASLSHPHLVTLHDAGTDEEHPPARSYLVMALVDGQSLSERLHTGALPEPRVRDLGIKVAEALGYVHSRGVVHRDIKPANILLDRDGRPFLTDFGIARALGAAALTAVGDTVGTAAYLSPEQVRGQGVGPASDVYALGLVLLEALTGVREYQGNTAETAVARLSRSPRIDESLPADWRELLAAMTATEPEDRPTAEQVVTQLSGTADADATRLISSVAAPPADHTRLLTTALPAEPAPPQVAGRAMPYVATALGAARRADDALWREVRRAPRLWDDTWSRARPWLRERRTAIAVALGALLLLLVVITVASENSAAPAAPADPPAGAPGPSRLAPDLDRLHELVQP